MQDFLEEDPGLANAVDETEFGTGYRPLHYAAYGGFLDVCEALHAAGARALAAGDNGVTALFLAAQAGKADVVRFLLDLVREREREALERKENKGRRVIFHGSFYAMLCPVGGSLRLPLELCFGSLGALSPPSPSPPHHASLVRSLASARGVGQTPPGCVEAEIGSVIAW